MPMLRMKLPGRGRPASERQGLVLAALLLAVGSLATPAWGGGFTLFQQGTAAAAQAAAFVAEADDPSAIYYNPAGLNQLKRPEIYMGGVFEHPDRNFFGPAGEQSETNHRWFGSGTIYATYPVNDRVAVGLGFFTPFGMGSQWPPTWVGRYITTFSSLKTYNVNPAISVKILDNLSVAAGLDIMWTDVELKRKIPVSLGGIQLADGESRLRGSAHGFGGNAGVLWQVVDGVKLGMSFRSQIDVNYQGTLELSNLPAQVPGPRSVAGSAKLNFPPFVTGGISISRLQPFTFNFDVTWSGWSSYDQLNVSLKQPILVNGVYASTLVTPKNWKDTWTFRFGMNYRLTEAIKLRAGYLFDLSPVPDETFDPQVPNANRHVFCVGGDWTIRQFTLGVAYNYVLDESRYKNNAITLNGVPISSQANGTYKSDAHLLAVSLTYKF